MMKFKLYLYKFLGKFSNYFKQKHMSLHKKSILNAINVSVREHFSKYSFINKFMLNEGLIIKSDMGLQGVGYKIIHNNAFEFQIKIKYENGLIKKCLLLPETDDYDISDISEFNNHFRAFNTDLSEMFIELNKLV